MIDVEAEIFTSVYNAVSTEYPGIYMTGEYVSQPPVFPCISLVEIDNATLRSSRTQNSGDEHAALTYELNVYSNRSKGRKAECKAIASYVDDILQGLNFTRTMLEPVPNMQDASIYRMTGRYRVIAGKDDTLYRR